MNSTHEVIKTAANSAPPVTYATLHIFGVSMPDWVAILTAIYILVQTAHLLWRWQRSWAAAGDEAVSADDAAA